MLSRTDGFNSQIEKGNARQNCKKSKGITCPSKTPKAIFVLYFLLKIVRMLFHKQFRINSNISGPRNEKTCLMSFANNKDADQHDQRLCYSLHG